MASLLIVDDESSLLDFLSLLFEQEGYRVTVAGSVTAARERLVDSAFDLVLCDITMPDGNGLEILQTVKEQDPRTAVIMMTAYTSTQSAIEAMKLGAYDYLSKPFDNEELKLVVQRALEKAELLDENVYLKQALEKKYTFSNIIGKSRRMRDIFGLIEKVAKTNSTVLIHGESGTGKELIARAIHFNSNRANNRFLSINCGALPENLLESELFGHEKGAFTGAIREKKGLFQEAHAGTLFLDEIGELSSAVQVKLLRALQERLIRKVGGNQEEKIDVRIIAATNRDLASLVAAGEFREDLFYRINVIPIEIPPLRHRREDIPILVDHFVQRFSKELDVEPKKLSVAAMRRLESYDWPGNVRELENLVERTLALTSGEVIEAEDLPPQISQRSSEPGAVIELPDEGLDLEAYLEDIRAQLMTAALERTNWVQTQAAELLGMSFRSFRYYAKKSGLLGKKEC